MSDAAEEVIDEVETPDVETDAVETEDVTDDVQANQKDEPSESSTEKTEGDGKEETDKFQKRVDELTAIRREEERQRIKAERRAQELEQQLEQLRPKQPAGQTLADFDYDESAYQEYLVGQAEDRARTQFQEQQAREQAQERQAGFTVRETDYAKEHDDYMSVTRDPSHVWLSQEMVNVAQGSDHGPALLHHLAKHPDEGSRISRLHPLDMAREMGRLEVTVSQPKPKPVSKTPEPAPSLKATGKPETIKASSTDSDKLSTEEWLKRRNKELANRK